MERVHDGLSCMKVVSTVRLSKRLLCDGDSSERVGSCCHARSGVQLSKFSPSLHTGRING